MTNQSDNKTTVWSTRLCKYGHEEIIDGTPMVRRYAQNNKACVKCQGAATHRLYLKNKDTEGYKEGQRRRIEEMRAAEPEYFKTYQANYFKSTREKHPERYLEYRRRREETRLRAAEGLPPLKYPRIVKRNDERDLHDVHDV